MIRSIAGSIARPLAVAITGASGGAAPDTYAANGFDPDYVADFSAASADYFRVAGVDSDFDTAFTSDSEGAGLATMVDSSGNLVWRAHNLLTYSEQFDNAAWQKLSAGTGSAPVVTANAGTAPDGTSTADRVQIDRGAGTATTDYSLVTQNATIAEGRTWAVWLKSNTGVSQTVNVYNGSFNDQVNATVTTSWQLFSVESGASFKGAQVAFGSRGGSYGGDETIDILVWGGHYYRSDLGGMADVPADQRAASTLTKYVPTTTAARYLLRRRHHYWTGSAWAPTLLHEPVAATNLLLNTNTLSTQDVTVTAEAHTLHFTGTGTVTLTGASTAGPLVGTGTGENNRVSLTFTPSAGTLTCTVSGTVTNAQLETGSVPSSYIPSGSAQATRAADTVKIKAAAFPANSTAVSYALNARISYVDSNSGVEGRVFERKVDGNNNVRCYIGTSGGSTGRFAFQQETGGTTDSVFAGLEQTPGVARPCSFAARSTSGAVQCALNGSAGSEDSTPTALADLSAADLELFPSGGSGERPFGMWESIRGWDADIAEAGIEEATA